MISGLVYLVVSPDDQDYVALVIRPYLPQQELTAKTQAALQPAASRQDATTAGADRDDYAQRQAFAQRASDRLDAADAALPGVSVEDAA